MVTDEKKFDDTPEWVKKAYDRIGSAVQRPKHLIFQPYVWECDSCHFKNSQMVYRDADFPYGPFMSEGPMRCSVCGTVPGILSNEDGKIMSNEDAEYDEFNKKKEVREQCSSCGCPLKDKDGNPLKVNEKGETVCLNCTRPPSPLGTAPTKKGSR